MIEIRKAADRGQANHGWLKSQHTFSFADYFDRRFMGFGPLRVINDDRVAPGAGFGTHPHRNMEIVSYVVDGALEHKDSMGHGSVIVPGEVQRMSAGTGVTHSEYNRSPDQPMRFLQIWIVPSEQNLPPSYEQKMFGERRHNRLCLVASNDGRDDSLIVHQNATIYASVLDAEQRLEHALAPDHLAYLQVVTGCLSFDGQLLSEGDGAFIREENRLSMIAAEDSDFLLFEIEERA